MAICCPRIPPLQVVDMAPEEGRAPLLKSGSKTNTEVSAFCPTRRAFHYEARGGWTSSTLTAGDVRFEKDIRKHRPVSLYRSSAAGMPQETLRFPPAYCIVGAYRLAHDALLWKPMWEECREAAKRAGLIAALWAVLTWPLQKLFVFYFMRGSAKVTGMSA